MAKTQKELAFLREHVIDGVWTQRFTELVDQHLDLGDADALLYLNAGTGSHALALDERFGEKIDIFAVCETDEILAIARDKAAAVGSRADFSRIRFEDDAFDAVIADGSFILTDEAEDLIGEAIRVAKSGGRIAVFLPTAGSYGEIFSFLWEVLMADADHSFDVEAMIAGLHSTTRLEEIAKELGMTDVETKTANEVFEFENGADLLSAPLIQDVLLPQWLSGLEVDAAEAAAERLAQLIDKDAGTLSFRFSVKATLLTGKKA